ncbi:MAG: DUF4058 family protein [Candidatus Viridilinea halotolerans]|uniref:DUF4058 family protein n=1 Tax=Candidatus Viridilinea halotolerans TaxID=2491704 RepID=A0A426U216_9CHLR|nr:MAG: DUF4058 family protein [Candidatus Viridilinea halotolerans]
MPTPFPGMDPYLEHPALWPDLHNSLISALSDELAPQLRPRYYVALEERMYTDEPGDLVLAGRADVALVATPNLPVLAPALATNPEVEAVIVALPLPDMIRETYLEVRTVASGEVVTVIELLSPSNKRPGEGREQYLRKRRLITGSRSHLVEIDLLRSGVPMPMQGYTGSHDYRIMVSRATQRPQAILLPFRVRQAIPKFHLPLYPGDPEPAIGLTPILHALYARRSYDLRVNYANETEPPLVPSDAAWADGLLRSAGLR